MTTPRAPTPATQLQGHAWYTALVPEHQALAGRETLLQAFEPGAFIARRGEPSRYWTGVDTGLIKLAVYTSDGRDCTFSGMPAGGWRGEGSAIRHEDRRYDVIAAHASHVLLVPEPVFNTSLAQSLSFAGSMVRQLNEHMGQFITTVQNDRLLSADACVTQVIAQLFHPALYPCTSTILELSQEEIGLLTGLSRQRMNRALQRLAEGGMIALSYQTIHVTDLERLRLFGLSEL